MQHAYQQSSGIQYDTVRMILKTITDTADTQRNK
jgi:hypothetical protein